jgi:proton glutamate symport protein
MKVKLHTQVFLGIILGVFCGILLRENATLLQPIGDIFIQLLRMMIIPIVFSSLVVGVISLGSIQGLGQLGARTFIYYIVTTVIAVTIGLTVVNTIKPGVGAQFQVTQVQSIQEVPDSEFIFLDIIRQIVPRNIINAAAEDQMLAVIFFSIFFGSALIYLGKKAEVIKDVIESFNTIVLKMTDWIMQLAPLGVFALMASLIGKTGLEAFKPLVFYMAVVLIGLAIHVTVTLSGALIFIAQYSPITLAKKMFPAFATAFSTDSSIATLPVTMDCLEKNVGVSKKVTGFVAPLGATINMDGTALYEAVAAIFIAQVYGIEMSLMQQIMIAFTATLASIGAAGIPSAGLITMVIVLRAVNLPLEGIGLLLAVDRILDMCRTTVNVMGDSCGAVIIARWGGERLQTN